MIRGYDAVTGKQKWAFDPGRPDDPTPAAPGKPYTPSTPNSWTVFSGDEALGLVYVPMGNGSPDYYGAHRTPETDRFTSAVVALDAEVQVAVDEEPLLRLRAGTRRVPAGASVRLTGSAPAGARVSIEARVRGRWTPVVRVSADAEGAFGTPVRLPAPGVYTVRARTGRALSPPVRLTAR